MVYIFSLPVGWTPGGVEYAQGYRAKMLKKHMDSVRYIFADLPRRREVKFYNSIGIDIESMLSVHHFFTDHSVLKLSVKAEDKLKELQEVLNCTAVEYLEKSIKLKRDNLVLAELLLDESQTEYIYAVCFYNNVGMVREEIFTDSIVYANYYKDAKLVRRTFYNKDGTVAYEQIFRERKSFYLFLNGEICTWEQYMARFVTNLHLSEKDIIFIDRGMAQCDYMQSLFKFGNGARFMIFLHMEHFYEKGQHPVWLNLYWNWEYLYFVKYSKHIQAMVVSTKQQEEMLRKKLLDYGCTVPDIKVIPVSGIEHLRYPEQRRKRFSMLTASRIDQCKRIDWIVKSVIKAHQVNQNISIDIYGGVEGGQQKYYEYMQELITSANAQSYIHFMGHRDISEIYKNYEVYITASTLETYGLSVMEAVGSGNALVGLDVRYGNRSFIYPEENGYLVDFDWSYIEDEEMMNKVINNMAEKIVEIFSDEQRLERFHLKSYEVAESFSSKVIAKKWEELLITT